jgi:hypothetical protein
MLLQADRSLKSSYLKFVQSKRDKTPAVLETGNLVQKGAPQKSAPLVPFRIYAKTVPAVRIDCSCCLARVSLSFFLLRDLCLTL